MTLKPITLVLVIISNPAFAMFCPNGFNQMNIGDTIDQVVQQCGNPDFKKTTKKEPSQPQEWNYYVKLNPKQTTSVKMSVAFDAKESVVNITTNSQSLIDTTFCGGRIAIGDSMETVKAACGTPAFINENKPSSSQTPNPNAIEITQFKYNTTPPVVLIFENGKLKERTTP